MKRTSLLAALLMTATGATAALAPGDVAFTAFNADEDGFAIVALRDIAPFSTVYFSDNEWSGGAAGSGSFTSGENAYGWVSGAEVVAAGTVVRFSAIDKAARAASVGAFGLVQSGAAGFAATGDTMFAYAGDSHATPAHFLAAVSTEAFAGSTLDGTGLVEGVNAVAVGAGADFAQYTGARTGLGSFAAYGALVNDAAQWTSSATGDFAATLPDLTAFAVGPVPEPQTYALLLSGLGLLGLQLRRARRAWPERAGAAARAA